MILPSLRLIRKRPFICSSLGFCAVRQAIGSEVAAETSRSAVMKAPAKTVAVWRAEESALNIGQTLLHFSAEPLRPRCQYQCRERANSKKARSEERRVGKGC